MREQIISRFLNDAIYNPKARKAQIVGYFWNDKNILILGKDERMFSLDGWDGEKYTDCYEVADGAGFALVSNKVYTVIPVYVDAGEIELWTIEDYVVLEEC